MKNARGRCVLSSLLGSTLVVLGLTAVPGAPPAWAQTTAQVANRALPAVVTITTRGSKGEGAGSGFILESTGLIATNYHVIDKVSSAKVRLNSGDVYAVEGVVDFDLKRDFAILKISAVELPVLALGNSNIVQPGEPVIALGSPLGTLTGSVSAGVVSQVRQMGEYRMIQHTADISPGSSGGPLLNARGEVIGLNTFLVKGGQGLYFALPINYVRGALAGRRRQPVTLAQLSSAVALVEREVAKKKLSAELKKSFYAYQDPDGWFRLLLPRAWQVQRNRYDDDENGGTSHVVMMASARDAERAKLDGWLSAGIRVHLRLPPRGRHWRAEWFEQWRKDTLKAVVGSYDRQRSKARANAKFGNLEAQLLTVVGTSQQLSRPEALFFYAAAKPKCLVTIEVVMPVEMSEELKVFNTILGTSFKSPCAQG